MEDVRLIVDIVIALGAATIGGLIAQRLGLPALIGYILAGLAIGPNTPGLVADVDRVQLLANLGVALLMFGLGVEFSLSEVIRVRRAALLGGAIQIPLTMRAGNCGRAGGWLDIGAALLLGGAFAISSSIVALKMLLGRGEMESPHARVALGLGIVQDFSLAPMLALMPVIAGQRGGGFGIAAIAADLGGGPDRRVSPRHPARAAAAARRRPGRLARALHAHHRGHRPRGGVGHARGGVVAGSWSVPGRDRGLRDRTSKSRCWPTSSRFATSSPRSSSSPSAC